MKLRSIPLPPPVVLVLSSASASLFAKLPPDRSPHSCASLLDGGFAEGNGLPPPAIPLDLTERENQQCFHYSDHETEEERSQNASPKPLPI